MRALVILIGLGAVGACGGDECEVDMTYDPPIDPAHFVTTIDNPLLPWTPGTTTVYEGNETVTVTVTSETKVILGVTAVVVRDVVTEDGEVIEDTFDWYAQDDEGNVWYLGEDTKELDGGEVVSTEGSWEAGVDGAKAGIVMHAVQPPAGEPYRQEYYPCVAEDMAEVVEENVAVTVTAGSYTGCLKTREFTPLESDVNEYKTFCPGVGLVLEEDVSGGGSNELVSITVP